MTKIVLFALAMTMGAGKQTLGERRRGQRHRGPISDESGTPRKSPRPGFRRDCSRAGRAHHLIDDAAHKRTFGYDLWVTSEAEGNTVQLRIGPMKFANPKAYVVQPGWTFVELPKYP